MAKLTKRMSVIRDKVDATKQYDINEAIALLKELATAKFVESVDVAVNLGIDARKSDQNVRGATVLPHGTGRSVRVAVFTQGANAEAAKAAGAELVGMEDLADQIKKGEMNFDVVIASPDAMRVVGQLGQVLALADFQSEAILLQRLWRKGALEQALHRGYQEGKPPRGQLLHQGQPPVLPLAGDGGGIVEGKGARGKNRHLLTYEGSQIPGQPFPLPFVGTHHYHGPPGHRPNPRGHVSPVDRRHPGQGGGRAAPLQGGEELLEFRDAVQGVNKQLHHNKTSEATRQSPQSNRTGGDLFGMDKSLLQNRPVSRGTGR